MRKIGYSGLVDDDQTSINKLFGYLARDLMQGGCPVGPISRVDLSLILLASRPCIGREVFISEARHASCPDQG